MTATLHPHPGPADTAYVLPNYAVRRLMVAVIAMAVLAMAAIAVVETVGALVDRKAPGANATGRGVALGALRSGGFVQARIASPGWVIASRGRLRGAAPAFTAVEELPITGARTGSRPRVPGFGVPRFGGAGSRTGSARPRSSRRFRRSGP